MKTSNILCHRGWWQSKEEQNTLAAFARAFDAGFGVELDVRDSMGVIVIQHDPVLFGKHTTRFTEILRILAGRDLPLAIHVKSCGLAPWFAKIKDQLPPRAFFFDLSTTDEDDYWAYDLNNYFRGDNDFWFDSNAPEDLEDIHLNLVMSAELFEPFDEECRQPSNYKNSELCGWVSMEEEYGPNFYLCTDHPQEAMEFFNAHQSGDLRR